MNENDDDMVAELATSKSAAAAAGRWGYEIML